MRGPPRPLRFLAHLYGSFVLAYYEIGRGWSTSVCDDCGRINHREADLCPCGGTVTPSPTEEELDVEPNDTDSYPFPPQFWGGAWLLLGVVSRDAAPLGESIVIGLGVTIVLPIIASIVVRWWPL